MAAPPYGASAEATASRIRAAGGHAAAMPLDIRDRAAEPIASGYLSLSTLTQADGWILVPPESEGYPPGAEVVIRPWP